MLDIRKDTTDHRPLLAIDFDDVLFDCDGALREILKREFGFRDAYSEFIKTNPHMQKDVFRFLYGSYHKNCAVINGACDAISRLAMFYRMVVITGRSEVVRSQTEKWLRSNFATIFSKVFFTNSFLNESSQEKREKVKICIDLGVTVLVDDSWEEAMRVASAGITTLLFDKPWNRKESSSFNVYRVRDWAHILTKLL